MAEIHVLPVRLHSLDQSDRLHADLAAAHARAENLGSRAPHIHACGERLLELTRTLENAIEDMEFSLNKIGLTNLSALENLIYFMNSIKKLAIEAQNFQRTL